MDATIKVRTGHKKDRTERGNYQGILLVTNVGKVLLKEVATKLSDFQKAKRLLPGEENQPTRRTVWVPSTSFYH